MDMSDVKHSGAPHRPTTPGEAADASRWHDLISAVGSEIAMPLTAALERINALTTTGKIDRAGLRALREEVELARHAGMIAQQLARFASGRLSQSQERLPLAETLKTVLAQRARETHARGITVKPTLKPADVVVDASLLFSLLNTMLDWSLEHARSNVEFAVDMKSWPAHARLTCRFSHRPADEPSDAAAPAQATPELETLNWRMLEQTAWTMGLPLTRSVHAGDIAVTLEFPRTANDEMEGVSSIELDQGFALSANSRPLAGSHVLVIASRREMRVRLRDAIRHMGLIVDLVGSVEEAADFVHEGLPHAIIVEGILSGERLRQLRAEICAELPEFPFIEIIEEGSTFEMSGFGGAHSMGRVGRDAIESALPSVLMFELSRSL